LYPTTYHSSAKRSPSITPITRIHSGPEPYARFGPPKKVNADNNVANVVNNNTSGPTEREAR